MDQGSINEIQLAVCFNPLIVEKIFHFLTGRDLSSSAQVCSLWYKISEAEKKRRRNVFCLFTVGPDLKHEAPCGCGSFELHNVEKNVFDQLENLRIQPAYCTVFMSTLMFRKAPRCFPSFENSEPSDKRQRFCENGTSRKYLQSVVDTVLIPFLPKNCRMAFAVSAGVIGYQADNVPLEVENGPAVCGYFIPQIPGVQVKHRAITGRGDDLTEFISKNEPVKSALLFLTRRASDRANYWASNCNSLKKIPVIAIGGAIVQHTESLLGSATIFCGPNVEAASVLIDVHDKAEEVATKLETFRETGLLKHKCIAYMFSCVGRGYYVHKAHNVESTIFSKMFPKVPIIGVFGEGEIGSSFYPHKVAEKKPQKMYKHGNVLRFFNSYCTIFLLISFKM